MRLTFIRRLLFFIFLSCNVFAKSNVVPGVFGDPHFTGWDGVHFDFNGKHDSIYCLISDKTFHMNMKFVGTVESTVQQRTWIKALGILFWGHRIILRAAEGSDLSHNGSGFLQNIEVDGAVIQLKQGENYRSLDGEIIISYDNYQSHKFLPSDHYSVYLKDMAEIHVIAGPEIPHLRSDNDAFIHLSVEMEKAVLSSQVHGVLGQTYLNAKGRLHRNSYRTKWNNLLVAQQVDGPNGEGYLDGEVADYISSGFYLQIAISQGLMLTLILPIRFCQRFHLAILVNICLTGIYWRKVLKLRELPVYKTFLLVFTDLYCN